MKISVIGAGAWGTTLSILLAENKHDIVLWAFERELVPAMKELRENKIFLPGFPLAEKIEITGEAQAAGGAQIIFFAVPTQFLRQTAKRFSAVISEASIVVCASKGIEAKTLKLPLEILTEELKNESTCVLSGPNLSSEIARGLPAASVIASVDRSAAEAAQKSLMSERFRVYTNTDVIGVQLGGALKNVIAIAAGVADGLELGDNAKAGLLIRGMVEISRLGSALGARPETFAGLSGLGDLIATCSSQLSRNHQVGERIARGEKLSEILKQMTAVAEGVPTAAAARELGSKLGVKVPITEEVYQVIYKDKPAYRALSDLMNRAPASE